MKLGSNLQGHVITEYTRGIRKGEFELKFDRKGVHYRSWWLPRETGKGYETENVRDHSGGVHTEFVAPPQSITADIKSGHLAKGPADIQGYKDFGGTLVGPIVEVCVFRDEASQIVQSAPTNNETKLFVKCGETRNVHFSGDLKKDPTVVRCVEGKQYFYFMYGITPNEWKLRGPFDPEKEVGDYEAAIKRLDVEQIDYARQAVRGILPEQESHKGDKLVNPSIPKE